MHHRTLPVVVLGMLFVSGPALHPVFANGIDRNGTGARSMGLNGASIADTTDAMAAMAANPALLGFQKSRQLLLGATAAFADGDYTSGTGSTGGLHGSSAVMPEAVLVLPVSERLVLGFSVLADSSRLANWRYEDPLGAAGVAYGQKTHRSQIINVRGALGAGYKLSDHVSLGASIGAVYNENQLDSPYIFQSHPALAGAKTLLDLETDGWSANADLGLAWEVSDTVTLGFGLRTPSKINSKGRALGDATRQLQALGADVDGTFRYDAEVVTKLPLKLNTGLAWEVSPRFRLYGQVEWINWADAYDDLTVRLERGTNATINSVLASDELVDVIPLDWKDRFVFRVAGEYDLNDHFTLRGGYSYGRSPVPDSTVLPLTAGISEHTLSAGLGWHEGPWSVDFAWQYDLPASQRAGVDGIAGTEYDNSKVEVSAHWLAVTVGRTF